MAEMLDEMQGGAAAWQAYEARIAAVREAAALLLRTSPARIALMPNVSIGAFQVASTLSLRERPRIVCSEEEFPSVSHVWLAQQPRGACVVHLNGIAVKSCTTLALQADGGSVLTIEGLAAPDGPLHPMQEAFREHHGLQCGFCTPGMVMTAVDMVNRKDVFGLDIQMLGVALVLSVLAGLISGVYPAWRICRLAPANHLKA